MHRGFFRFFCIVCVLALCEPLFAQNPEVLRKLRKHYTYVGSMKEGRLLVSPNATSGLTPKRLVEEMRFGYVDTLGKMVIPMRFDYATDFAEGLALVGTGKCKVRKFGYIDTTGRIVVPIEYDDAEIPCEGLLKVMRCDASGNPQWGYLSTSGTTVVPMEYGELLDPAEGVIAAARGEWRSGEDSSEQTFEGTYGFLDYQGKEAIPFRYVDARSFQNGLAAVAIAGKYYPKWGFIDRKGQLRIPHDYYEVGDFQEDLAVAARVVGGKLYYGYIDSEGHEVIPLRYASAEDFHDGIALVSDFSDSNYAPFYLIDRKGTSQLPYALYDVNNSGRYGHMTAAVPDSNGVLRYGLIDKYGRQVLPFAYDNITIFSEWDAETQSWNERGIAVQGNQELPFSITRKRK